MHFVSIKMKCKNVLIFCQLAAANTIVASIIVILYPDIIVMLYPYIVMLYCSASDRINTNLCTSIKMSH